MHADLLAGRKTVGAMRGSILYAGHAPTTPFLRCHTGYVEQCGAAPGHAAVCSTTIHTAWLILSLHDSHDNILCMRVA